MSLATPSLRRRTIVRTVVALSAIAATVGALTGCSAGSGGSESKTVTFLSWDNQQTMQPVFAEFEKENPGYTVKASYAPPVPQYIQKLQTQLGSGSAPDVFIITAENKTQIMNGGFAKDLSGEPWISNVAKAARDTYTKDGKVYGAAVASWAVGSWSIGTSWPRWAIPHRRRTGTTSSPWPRSSTTPALRPSTRPLTASR